MSNDPDTCPTCQKGTSEQGPVVTVVTMYSKCCAEYFYGPKSPAADYFRYLDGVEKRRAQKP